MPVNGNSPSLLPARQAGGEEDGGQDESGGAGEAGRQPGAGGGGQGDSPPDTVRQSGPDNSLSLHHQEDQVR